MCVVCVECVCGGGGVTKAQFEESNKIREDNFNHNLSTHIKTHTKIFLLMYIYIYLRLILYV